MTKVKSVTNIYFILLDDDMTKTNKHNIIQEDHLTDQVEIAYNLITRLRQLLTMEKTDAIMERSLNRTNFFKINNDLGKVLLLKTYTYQYNNTYK